MQFDTTGVGGRGSQKERRHAA